VADGEEEREIGEGREDGDVGYGEVALVGGHDRVLLQTRKYGEGSIRCVIVAGSSPHSRPWKTSRLLEQSEVFPITVQIQLFTLDSIAHHHEI